MFLIVTEKDVITPSNEAAVTMKETASKISDPQVPVYFSTLGRIPQTHAAVFRMSSEQVKENEAKVDIILAKVVYISPLDV